MAYYIYENWRARGHRAMIHQGACHCCNDGTGVRGGYDPQNAEWHGPFPTLEAARAHQRRLNAKKREECSKCLGSS